MAYRFTETCLLGNYRPGFQKQEGFQIPEGFMSNLENSKALLQKPRKLWLAAGGNEEHLAFEDQVRIADDWIRLSDAGPIRSVAKVGLGDGRQRVALLHGDLRCGPNRGDRRQENLRACLDPVRVTNRRIDGEQFLPASSPA